ncbi:chitin synthase chs-2-like [Uloborus diversus]|uniref:chitin synthase chs-2-like n=1 Tax=Uloborus diversus TaxID=327109 RepID=UPI00240A0AF5|nr:chitin synthase chs-2-like [Uloborus diversus]
MEVPNNVHQIPDFPRDIPAAIAQRDLPQNREMEEKSSDALQHWNLFGLKEDESFVSNENTFFKVSVKILKALVYLLTFAIVLSCGVISKGTLLFMTSAIEKGRHFTICNEIMGTLLLIFVVFPQIHSMRSLSLTSAICFCSSFLNLITVWDLRCRRESMTRRAFDIAALLFQTSGVGLCIAFSFIEPDNRGLWWCAGVSLLLTSFAWWENFVNEDSSVFTVLVDIKSDVEESRSFIYLFISLWKMVFTFVTLLTHLAIHDDVKSFFSEFKKHFQVHNVTSSILTVGDAIGEDLEIPNHMTISPEFIPPPLFSNPTLPLVVTLLHIVGSYVCYTCGRFVCKICIQVFSYALPVCLTVPLTLCLLITACSMRIQSTCAFAELTPYLFWSCPKDLPTFLFKEGGFVLIFWIVSQVIITIHIWTPKEKRMASTNELFVNPLYSTAFIDQSLALNRRKEKPVRTLSCNFGKLLNLHSIFFMILSYMSLYDSAVAVEEALRVHQPPRILACATMWHETLDEMEQLLKSIMRMDGDQCSRRLLQEQLNWKDPDYYEMEAHIFFDDAFVISDEDDDKMVVNSFVKELIVAVDTAAGKVYDTETFQRLEPPLKVPTPYGGRLIWRLQGDNLLIAHLKNKELIRHKKRWSQVMYMYYLLGYQLMDPDVHESVRELLARNTFILALDGDIDFKPEAVGLLVDLMKRDQNLGAACGRIHPVGTGMMVYYQKFEYAIGHWLQKATEHMIGCVLCSPGCFSLFRAEALMKDNVVRRYATKSKEAIEYVQFDQGEDRWLCTLLLQSGSRVEYSAASDAYTHCPESFAELFTQRRRWAPSTMANIMDLLVNYKKTVECNDNISALYISYQLMLMVGTILGPGTIFLMLVGAMVSAFGISNWYSFLANLVPIAFFILLCFLAKNDTQIFVAQIFSALYALLMMAVLVGISLQLVTDGVTSPTAIFLLSMTASFIIAALVHPQEFWCVMHGLIYFLSVPSMYLLLALYSIINLHVVSWGTREVQVKKSKKQLEQERLQSQPIVAKQAEKKGGVLDWINILNDKRGATAEEEGSITFGLANLFRCMCCTYPKPDSTQLHMIQIAEHLNRIEKEISDLQKQIDTSANRLPAFRRRSVHALQRDNLNTVQEDEPNLEEISASEEETSDTSEEHTYNQPEPLNQNEEYWMTEPMLQKSPVKRLYPKETEFWKEFIKTYLEPLADNPEEKAKVAQQLIELRNKVVFGILMLNSLFILIVFLLQMQKDTLYVEWPLSDKANISYIARFNEVRIDIEYLQLEPINLVLVFFFALILIVQFIAMLFHRFQTLSHILASTDMRLCSKAEDKMGNLKAEAADILRRLSLRDDDEPQVPNARRRRSTVHMLDKKMKDVPKFESLSVALEYSLQKIREGDPRIVNRVRRMSKNPEVIDILKRKTSILPRRSSTAQISRASTPRASMIFDMERLEREFGTPRGSFSNSYINHAYDDSLDTESVHSIQMTTPTRKSPFNTRRSFGNQEIPSCPGSSSLQRKIIRAK